MDNAPLIGVCGPIGAGKSTIVTEIASVLGLCARLERVEANPFFERFASDRATWAFWSQLAFLTGAIDDAAIARRQGGGVLERPAEEMLGVFVRDLHDVGLLDGDELRTLAQVVEIGERLAGAPDLLVVLHGDPQELLERLRNRRDPGDDSYDLADMRRLANAYDRWRATLDDRRVIDVDVAEVDLRSASAIRDLAEEVRSLLALPSGEHERSPR
jgi:deoxyadenosine/deoxycytidine kinase